MKFGDVVRFYTSRWLCLVISQPTQEITLMTLFDDSDQTKDMPMYELGKPFRWTLPNPERMWRIERDD